MKYLFYCFVIFCSFSSAIDAQESSTENPFESQISQLGVEQSFAYVDLKLTSKELDLIDQLNFDLVPEASTVEYERFGDLHLVKDELITFLESVGNSDENVVSTVAEVISNATQKIVSASHKNSAWVCVRASKPNANFDTPRWHMDGAYFGLDAPHPNPGLVYKFAATLIGRSTLLYHLTRDQRVIFNEHWDDRNYLSEFIEITKVESPKRGEWVVFIVADNTIAAAHSEPPVHSNRLFFSILVGDKAEIQELYLRWHP